MTQGKEQGKAIIESTAVVTNAATVAQLPANNDSETLSPVVQKQPPASSVVRLIPHKKVESSSKSSIVRAISGVKKRKSTSTKPIDVYLERPGKRMKNSILPFVTLEDLCQEFDIQGLIEEQGRAKGNLSADRYLHSRMSFHAWLRRAEKAGTIPLRAQGTNGKRARWQWSRGTDIDPVRELICQKYFKTKHQRTSRVQMSASELLIKQMAERTNQKRQTSSPRKKRPRAEQPSTKQPSTKQPSTKQPSTKQPSKPPMTLDVAKARAARSLRRLVMIMGETKDAQLMPCSALQDALAKLFALNNGGPALRSIFESPPL